MSAFRNRPLLQWGWGQDRADFSFHPELAEENEAKILSKFHLVGTDYAKDHPARRSGHRIFITENFLYAIGGYDCIDHGFVYRDVWRMNLLTEDWERLHIENETEFPTALASFAICQTGQFSNQVVLFGGTGIPFGEQSSSNAFVLTVDDNEPIVRSQPLHIEGAMRPVYGHVLIRNDEDKENPKFYSIGGTSGLNFFLDVDCLQRNSEGKWQWKRESDGPNDGLYRMEGVYENGQIILLGGGTPHMVKDFEKLISFNVGTGNFSTVATFPDHDQAAAGDSSGYPAPRRCHSVTRFGNLLVVAGGCSEDLEGPDQQLNIAEGRRYVNIYGDVWFLDLETLRWRRHPHDLAVPVFFHSADISQDGCLYVFGGVEDRFSKSRVDICQAMWLQPPSLLYLASRTVDRLTNEKNFKPTMSQPMKLASSMISLTSV